MALALLAGCGDSSNGDVANGLYINAVLGARLVQSPITAGANPEGGFAATVFITRDNPQGAQVAAKLTVNGVEVPAQTVGGVVLGYDFSHVVIPGAVPGGTLTLHASFESYSAELTLHCPSEVSITAPAEGSHAATGEQVTVSWSGDLSYATSIKPDVMVHGLDPVSGERSDLTFADRVVAGKSSDMFALPDPQGAPEWLVDLYVPGDLVDDAAGLGFCMLDRRVHIISQ